MLKRKLFGWLFMLGFILVLPTMYVQANTESPVIEKVEVLTPNVTIGETVKVRVKVSDDSNKIETIRTTFLSPNKKDQISIELNIKESDPIKNTYTLESEKVPSKYEAGKWTASLIQIRDVTGAFANYTSAQPGELKYEQITFDLKANTEKQKEIAPKITKVAKDNFKATKPVNNVKIDHEFSLTFNMDVMKSTFTKKNIYVTDQDGKNIPLLFVKEYDKKTKKSVITIAPVDNYKKNSKYTLYVKDIIGQNDKKITQNTKTDFTTRK